MKGYRHSRVPAGHLQALAYQQEPVCCVLIKQPQYTAYAGFFDSFHQPHNFQVMIQQMVDK